MNDRSRHLLHRAGDAAPWVVGVLAVGALLVPMAGAWDRGGGTRSLDTAAPAPRRISFQRPLRSAVHPRLRPGSPTPATPAPPAVPAVPARTGVGPTVIATAPAAAAGTVSPATTRPPRGARLPPGFPSAGRAYVFVDQPARAAGARTVAVLGDSLTVGASPGLQAFLTDVNLRLDARVSRPTLEGVQAAASTKASRADIVVVALGSNDSCAVAECRRRVDAVLAAVGTTSRVVWMPPVMFRPSMQAMRTAITAAAAASAGRVTVLDWQPYVDDHPEIKSSDGIHLTSDGYRLRAQVTADEVHRLTGSR
ncbi:MAG: GDSL-type esterase/lipase family protein [Acidimicrobiales bacterium]